MSNQAIQKLGFIALYKEEQLEVYAPTRYLASEKALKHFQAKYPRRRIRPHEVTSILAERNGTPIVHSTASIG